MCTPEDVKLITGSNLPDATIQAFIDAAECIIERIEDCITDVSASCKDKACTFLSAHLMTTSAVGQGSALKKSESLAGEYSVERVVSSYNGQGVLSTAYGVSANAILGGCLQEADLRKSTISSVGADYENNVGYIC